MASRSTAVAKRTNPNTDLTVKELIGRMQRIQQIQKKLMKPKVHYGIVPGTDKPSLWKPGAEMLCTAFRIAPSYASENLSDDDHYEFIVTCTGTHQVSGQVLGQGIGSGSSNEEKYKWRASLNDEEFASVDEDRTRVKFKKVWNEKQRAYEVEKINQIRTEPADLVNTVLKMAAKRAFIAMVINVLAASDIFLQDAEELSGIIDDEQLHGGGGSPGGGGRQPANPPRSTGAGGSKAITPAQKGLIVRKLGDAGIDGKLLCEHFKVNEIEQLLMSQMDEALAWIQGPKGSNVQA